MHNIFFKNEDLLRMINHVACEIVNDWKDWGRPCDINEWMNNEFIPLLSVDVEFLANYKTEIEPKLDEMLKEEN